MPIKLVSQPVGARRGAPDATPEKCYEGDGILVNSEEWNSWRYPEDLDRVINWLEKRGFGKRKIQYKLRDWCISRQRYWGPPIPMIYCPHCAAEGKSWFTTEEAKKSWGNSKSQAPNSKQIPNPKFKNNIENCKLKIENSPPAGGAGWYPVPEDQLPVLLPDTDDYLPGEAGGKPPLARLANFVKVKCPYCGREAQRETDVSDTFLDSSWYFLAYPNTDTEEYKGVIAIRQLAEKQSNEIATSSRSNVGTPRNDKTIAPFNPQITKKWLPVDQYTGGAEHSVLHLLYSRFITMALHDLGYLHFEEPFSRFYAHGLIIKDGAKMSKSRGNVVNPDEYIEKFGADALRAYLMFLGPFNVGGDFRDTGMVGMYKFLGKVYKLCQGKFQVPSSKFQVAEFSSKEEAFWVNKTIKKVGEDIGKFKYNTAIAAIMEFVNFLVGVTRGLSASVGADQGVRPPTGAVPVPSPKALKTLILLLAPFAPHLAEELWQVASNQQPATSGNKDWQRATGNGQQFKSVHQQPWPKYDPELIKQEKITIVVQVNGKVRDKIIVGATGRSPSVSANNKNEIVELAKQSQKVSKYLKGKQIKKAIFVPGKLVNFVVK